jgi:hypothetical protein
MSQSNVYAMYSMSAVGATDLGDAIAIPFASVD